MRIEDLAPGAMNLAPIQVELDQFTVPVPGQAQTFQAPLGKNIPLDFLVVNEKSDVLVVALHGATDRAKYKLPRFEWLNTVAGNGYSSLYFSDPTLKMKDASYFQLAWYAGWPEIDLNAIMAEVVRSAAAQLGSKHILVVGASGGGFAALQLAARLPDSIAVSLNGQTEISSYHVDGKTGAQRVFIDILAPYAADTNLEVFNSRTTDWTLAFGNRLSAIRTYTTPVPNRAIIVQNTNDAHHYYDHYLPIRRAIETGRNVDRVRFAEYAGASAHVPPPRATFMEHLASAETWSKSR
ncbi:pimeloyl-ACP methyl ester carboxylesterase [Arthrobacter sp. CAN_A212]|uniref:alpha/beta hydrolase n=1 Tax=Arthrobacter sp. CAN_A212 TaxID=2787719 RepID=UPI0018C92951